MKTRIVLTGILKDKDLFLVVKRNGNDDLYPGAWEFPNVISLRNYTIKKCGFYYVTFCYSINYSMPKLINNN